MINGFRLSSQILANMNKKVRNKYGAETAAAAMTAGLSDGNAVAHHSFEKGSSEES